MNIRIIGLVIIGLFASCQRVAVLEGLYEEKYIGPAKIWYRFDSGFVFEKFVDGGMVNSFSRGGYSLKGNKLILNPDSIYVDSCLVVKSKKGEADSVELELLLYDQPLIDTNVFIFSSDTNGSYYIIPDYKNYNGISLYELPTRLNLRVRKGGQEFITIRIFDLVKSPLYDIKVNIGNFDYLKLEYFPSRVYWDFNSCEKEEIKLKKSDGDIIEFKFDDGRLTQGYKLFKLN